MSSRQCSLHVTYSNGRTLMRIAGEIDVSNAGRLEDTLTLVDGAIIVDCSQLDFLDLSRDWKSWLEPPRSTTA